MYKILNEQVVGIMAFLLLCRFAPWLFYLLALSPLAFLPLAFCPWLVHPLADSLLVEYTLLRLVFQFSEMHIYNI